MATNVRNLFIGSEPDFVVDVDQRTFLAFMRLTLGPMCRCESVVNPIICCHGQTKRKVITYCQVFTDNKASILFRKSKAKKNAYLLLKCNRNCAIDELHVLYTLLTQVSIHLSSN